MTGNPGRIAFAFDSPPPEKLALDAYGAALEAKYGKGFHYNAVPVTPEEEAEIHRLNQELDAAHLRAFTEYHRERVRRWRSALRDD